MKEFIRGRFLYILAFLTPVMILAGVFARLGIYPFGNLSVLVMDLNGQYIDFYSALRRMVFDQESPIYSWGFMMGGNITGIISYYLTSPFSIISILLPKEWIVESILLMILAKVGCSGLSMAVFLKHSLNAKGIDLLIFSTPYALMAYVSMYFYNLMWLDGLVFLPLLALGIENIVSKNNADLFYISLVLAIIANYYIGFMLCLFSILYFLYQMFIQHEGGNLNKFFIRRSFSFAQGGILSIGTAAVILIPTLFSLTSGKISSEFGFDLNLLPNFSVPELIPKFLLGAYDTAQGNLPNVYCGLAMILLATTYFVNHTISFRRRMTTIILLLIFFLSIYLNGVNQIWHGFQKPAGFPYRYSFILCFIIIYLAYQGFQSLGKIRLGSLLICFVLSCAGVLITMIQKPAYLTDKVLLASLCFCGCYCFVLFLMRQKPRLIHAMKFLLTGLILIEVGINTWIYIQKTNLEFRNAERVAYSSYVNQLQPMINNIHSFDQSFYRVEKTFRRSVNDPLNMDYRGISHFSSAFSQSMLNFARQTGFFQPFYGLDYTGQTIPMDSILGIKYILSTQPSQNNYKQINNTTSTLGEIFTYQNPYALPLGFLVDSSLLDLHIDSYHPIYWQERILQSMVEPKKLDFFNPIKIKKINLVNLETQEITGDWVKYSKRDKQSEGTIELQLLVENENPNYAFLVAKEQSKMGVYLNKEFLGYFGENSQNNHIITLGHYPKGTELSFLIKVMFDSATLLKDNLIYGLDLANFSRAYDSLAAHPLEIIEFNDTFIRGSIQAEQGGSLLFTSIPYDNGWAVRLDGKEVSKLRLIDTFIGVEIPAGLHSIEFSYTPPGLWIGITITLISLFLIFIRIVYINSKKKSTHLRSTE